MFERIAQMRFERTCGDREKVLRYVGPGDLKVGVAMMPSGYDASVTFEDFVQLLLYYHLMDVVQWSGVICLIVRRTGLRT
jgi:hypothetical protein